MIRRTAEARLRKLAKQFAAVTVTGPRQAGKTTLCRALFPEKPYVSLEAPDVRERAQRDPRGFLAAYRAGAVFDEVQRFPDLLSYLQGEIDARRGPGRFILTGSANFALLQSVSQSLAGRTALLTLLPFSFEEIGRTADAAPDLFEALCTGSYPAIWDQRVDAWEWLAAYVGNYVERDVRQVLNVGDLVSFQTFLRLCAGRSGQLLNLASLAADAGLASNTAKAWLSVLEASYIAFRLPPFSADLTSRLVKTPKLSFFDSGLMCYLLGIRRPEQLREHPLRGAIFETWVVSEIYKARVHRGLPATLSFFRDRKGLEVDLLVERALDLLAVEIKSGQTIAGDFTAALAAFGRRLAGARPRRRVRPVVVYGGRDRQQRDATTVLPWCELDSFAWTED
jgi:hypothetical protein